MHMGSIPFLMSFCRHHRFDVYALTRALTPSNSKRTSFGHIFFSLFFRWLPVVLIDFIFRVATGFVGGCATKEITLPERHENLFHLAGTLCVYVPSHLLDIRFYFLSNLSVTNKANEGARTEMCSINERHQVQSGVRSWCWWLWKCHLYFYLFRRQIFEIWIGHKQKLKKSRFKFAQ